MLLSCAVFILQGCANSPPAKPSPQPSGPPEVANFAGYWEKNYQLSDDFNTEFNLFMYDVRRRSVQQTGQGTNSALGGLNTASGNMDSIIGLARFTEEITRMPLLTIAQDRSRVRIEREDDFNLSCEFFNQAFVSTENPFGRETCGWRGNQLLFQINFADGLAIFHQVTLGPEGQELNITTTVSSSQVSTPLTISNYYRRYTPAETGIDCVLTLTRNNVCTRKPEQ